MCHFCKWPISGDALKCEAFPDGIPKKYLFQNELHLDGEIHFEIHARICPHLKRKLERHVKKSLSKSLFYVDINK